MQKYIHKYSPKSKVEFIMIQGRKVTQSGVSTLGRDKVLSSYVDKGLLKVEISKPNAGPLAAKAEAKVADQKEESTEDTKEPVAPIVSEDSAPEGLDEVVLMTEDEARALSSAELKTYASRFDISGRGTDSIINKLKEAEKLK